MREISFDDENLQVIGLMREIDKFDLLSEQDLRGFIKAGKFLEYETGEVVIREGEYDCFIYFLITGQLEITKAGKHVGHLQRNGDMFGEMGVIDGSPRSATIKAKSKCLVLGIDGAVIDHKLKASEMSFCYIIYRLFAEVLAVRLRETTEENTQLRKALAKFGS